MEVADAQNALILIVDDDEELTSLIARWLVAAGYRCETSSTGQQAIAALGKTLPDLILLDLDLGDMNGLEVLRALREKDRACAVIMLTAMDDPATIVQAMRAGAYDYMVKPVQRPKVLSASAEALSTVVASAHKRRNRGERPDGYLGMLGRSAPMLRAYEQIDRVAQSDITVLIGGESGTGKELAARAIHSASGRSLGPFVPVNCGAIAQGLQESELFGHEKGAFTGANARRLGRFEQASGGIIFLDEVGELTPSLQVALLRVLQERSFYRVGGATEVHVDVRVVAATHRNLTQDVQEGRFREDLFYRLAVYELEMPPLREREGDILLLAERFLESAAAGTGRPAPSLSEPTREVLQQYPWPGNVRELENAMRRAAVAATDRCSPSTSRVASSMPPMKPLSPRSLRWACLIGHHSAARPSTTGVPPRSRSGRRSSMPSPRPTAISPRRCVSWASREPRCIAR